MRDPARIEPMLAKIREVWEKYPDLRLGQMISAAHIMSDNPEGRISLFNIEDDIILKGLERLSDK